VAHENNTVPTSVKLVLYSRFDIAFSAWKTAGDAIIKNEVTSQAAFKLNASGLPVT